MNLNINLTLGNPGAESVLNTAVSADSDAADGFSLKLADELNEQELNPPLTITAEKKAAPLLFVGSEIGQKLAVDAEVVEDKPGRVWLLDPKKNELHSDDVDTLAVSAKDKPWFDIIEKAKNYGPALQVNKAAVTDEQLITAVTDEQLITAVTDEQLVTEATDTTCALFTPDLANEALADAAEQDLITPQVLPDHDLLMQVVVADKKQVSEEVSLTSAVEQNLNVSDELADIAVDGATEAKPVMQSADTLQQFGWAKAENRSDLAITSSEHVPSTIQGATAAQANSEAVKVEQPVTSLPTAAASMNKTKNDAAAVAKSALTKDSDREKVLSVAVGDSEKAQAAAESTMASLVDGSDKPVVTKLPEAAAAQLQERLAQVKAGANTQSGDTSPVVSENLANPESLQQAVMAAEALAGVSTPKQSGSRLNSEQVLATNSGVRSEKVPAANAFAEHLKSVNQNQQQQQQQQQQPGAEQQQAQGGAKPALEFVMPGATTPAAAAQGNAPVFATQLQHSLDATAASPANVQPLTPAAASTMVHHNSLTSRLSEPQVVQTPLALNEPAAAQLIKDRVMIQIQHKLQTAEVQLHPEELGSMQIKLNLQQDQLSVQFVVQQGAAKDALEQQMPRLKELLEQQGIALTEGQVEQRQSGEQREQRHARSGHADSGSAELSPAQTVQVRISDRMVDFYA